MLSNFENQRSGVEYSRLCYRRVENHGKTPVEVTVKEDVVLTLEGGHSYEGWVKAVFAKVTQETQCYIINPFEPGELQDETMH